MKEGKKERKERKRNIWFPGIQPPKFFEPPKQCVILYANALTDGLQLLGSFQRRAGL